MQIHMHVLMSEMVATLQSDEVLMRLLEGRLAQLWEALGQRKAWVAHMYTTCQRSRTRACPTTCWDVQTDVYMSES